MILLESRDVKFRVQYPNASGHEVELDGTVAILGRDPSCDLVLNDVKCSRRHAVVEAGPQGLAIRDTGSANGVFLNGKKIDRSALGEGDVFRLGDVFVTVLAEDMPGALPAPPPRPSAILQSRNTETVPPHLRPVAVASRARPEPQRPLTLTVLAILWTISVLLYPAAGLAAARSGTGVGAALAVGSGLALAVVSAGMAFGLWKRLAWARGAQIGIAGLGLLFCPFTLASAVVLAYMLRPATAGHLSGSGPAADPTRPDAAELTFTGLIMAAVVLGTVLAAGTVLFLRVSTTSLPPR